MSMICTLKQISPRILGELEKKPKLVKKLIESQPSSLEEFLAQVGVDPSDPEATLAYVSTNPRISHLAGYFEQVVIPALGSVRKRKPKINFNENQATSLCIEKAWHAVHFALAGSTEATGHPLDRVILSGSEIGDPGDFGYGCPHYLTPGEVVEIAGLLENTEEGEIRQRLAGAPAQGEIYAFSSTPEDAAEVVGTFQAIRGHYTDAAAKGNAMLIYIV